jgi:hypothetical protein
VKFKTTIIAMAGFVLLLGYMLFFDKKAPDPKAAGPEEKLVTLASADIQKITLKKESETLTFKKDDKGDWMIAEPMDVKADNAEVNILADAFADLKIERVVEKEGADLKKYQIPQKEVSIWTKGQAAPVKVLVGMENPLDKSLFAQKDGDKRVVLLPSTLAASLDKKIFDFRQKDVFKLETGDVAGIKLQAKDVQWEAQKKDEAWTIQAPFKALAKDVKITAFLEALSNLKAKEFNSETKSPDDLKKAGLDKPETRITLSMPKANKQITFLLHKAADKTFVTTSESNKIIVPDSDPFAEIDKKADEYRETKVAAFNTWQAAKVVVKKGGLDLTLTKGANDKWYFDAAQKEEADASKIETFVRKIESLESTEFVDAPKSLAEYGLDKPQAAMTVTTKDAGEKAVEKTFSILVGKDDKATKKAVVKNARLDYLFRVDSSFLDEFPKDGKDWKVPEPEKKEPDKKDAPAKK